MDPPGDTKIGIVQYWFILHFEGHSKEFLCNMVRALNHRWYCIYQRTKNCHFQNKKVIFKGCQKFLLGGANYTWKLLAERAPPPSVLRRRRAYQMIMIPPAEMMIAKMAAVVIMTIKLADVHAANTQTVNHPTNLITTNSGWDRRYASESWTNNIKRGNITRKRWGFNHISFTCVHERSLSS